MNNLIFNKTAKRLSSTLYGVYDNDYIPIACDSNGLFLFSPSSIITVTATDFDIRNLNFNTDSVTVTASNLDIRNLDGQMDFVSIYQKGFVEQNISQSIGSGTSFILTRDISPYSENSFFIRNLSGATITVAAQVAPENDDSLFYDLVTQTVGVLSNAVLNISVPIKFARLKIIASTTTSINAYYNGRA